MCCEVFMKRVEVAAGLVDDTRVGCGMSMCFSKFSYVHNVHTRVESS